MDDRQKQLIKQISKIVGSLPIFSDGEKRPQGDGRAVKWRFQGDKTDIIAISMIEGFLGFRDRVEITGTQLKTGFHVPALKVFLAKQDAPRNSQKSI